MKKVLDFLSHFKNISEKDIIFVRRPKNNSALLELNISEAERLKIIFSLVLEDYVSGPEIDRDRENSGKIWVFGKENNGREIYIKLKIINRGKDKAICISFHLAEFPLNFPLRGQKK
jgi:hypothetical protein